MKVNTTATLLDWPQSFDDIAVAEHTKLPLNAYLRLAKEENDFRANPGEEWDEQWSSALFHFVRRAKAHPDLRQMTAMEALKQVERWLGNEYLEISVDQAWTEFRFIDNPEDGRTEFVWVWDEVYSLPGVELWQLAKERVEREEPLEFENRRHEEYANFVNLVGWFQVMRGPLPIFLPTRKVAEVLGVNSNRTASAYIHWAEEDEFLRLVKKHPRERRKGYEFVFAVHKFPRLNQEFQRKWRRKLAKQEHEAREG